MTPSTTPPAILLIPLRATLAKAHRLDPDKLSRLVEPDLDWIVMKAIDKDRTGRCETARGLAADIARFLADEPVSARPPSADCQMRKFARRHKATLPVAAGIAAVLVVATVASLWLAVRATDAGKKTAATLKEVTTERDAKELARQDAEAISKFPREIFQSPDPTRDKAAKKLETDLAVQPARRASLQATLGRTYQALGLYQQVIPLPEKWRDYCVAAFGPKHPATSVR